MNKESLFSITALKNLVPSAFTELQKSQGFIYEIVVQGKFDEELIKGVNEELEIIDNDFQEIAKQINNEESDEFFENIELVVILLVREISSDNTLFVKLFENINVEYLNEYFIFNLKERTLSKSTIEQNLNLFLENDITEFSIEEYDCIFDNLSNRELFVDLIKNLFKNRKLNEISIKNVTYWLGTQNKPISELTIDENGKNKSVEIENTPQNVELVNNLDNIGIVSTFYEKEGSIIEVNMRRKVPKELKTEIL